MVKKILIGGLIIFALINWELILALILLSLLIGLYWTVKIIFF